MIVNDQDMMTISHRVPELRSVSRVDLSIAAGTNAQLAKLYQTVANGAIATIRYNIMSLCHSLNTAPQIKRDAICVYIWV